MDTNGSIWPAINSSACRSAMLEIARFMGAYIYFYGTFFLCIDVTNVDLFIIDINILFSCID